MIILRRRRPPPVPRTDIAQEPHIVRFELDEQLLLNYARRVNRPTEDINYVVHGALCGAINGPVAAAVDHTPRPYSIEPKRGGTYPIVGYIGEDAEKLKARIAQFGDVEASQIIHMNTLFTKPLPKEWPEHVGFSVRVSQERPFLRTEEEYVDWMTPLFEERGATIDEAYMVDFGIYRACRRSHPDASGYRSEHWTNLPDARMAGILRINDQALFGSTLPTGLGRQKFAGFGMVKLHPLS